MLASTVVEKLADSLVQWIAHGDASLGCSGMKFVSERCLSWEAQDLFDENAARPDRQARLSRFIRQPTSDVVPLDRVDAVSVGRLLAASGTTDVVDAHVVLCARRSAQRVVTSDPSELSPLDPTLELIVV